MSDDNFSKEQQLDLILDMINQAKQNFAQGSSFNFLLWGWVISIANLGHYVLDKFDLYEAPYIVWLITIPAAVISIWDGYTSKRKVQTTSLIDTVYASIWITILVMVVICLIFMAKLNFNHNPIILLFSGLGTFISGILMKYRPVKIGGIILWVGACMGLMTNVTNQQLIAAIAVIFGYLVPGYMLKGTEKK
ncbi:MAG: hypothetical protein AAF789_10160 [Bacteroidota bacterium]